MTCFGNALANLFDTASTIPFAGIAHVAPDRQGRILPRDFLPCSVSKNNSISHHSV